MCKGRCTCRKKYEDENAGDAEKIEDCQKACVNARPTVMGMDTWSAKTD